MWRLILFDFGVRRCFQSNCPKELIINEIERVQRHFTGDGLAVDEKGYARKVESDEAGR
jgi:hypothetical protein